MLDNYIPIPAKSGTPAPHTNGGKAAALTLSQPHLRSKCLAAAVLS